MTERLNPFTATPAAMRPWRESKLYFYRERAVHPAEAKQRAA